jgi:hypothetical protein
MLAFFLKPPIELKLPDKPLYFSLRSHCAMINLKARTCA